MIKIKKIASLFTTAIIATTLTMSCGGGSSIEKDAKKMAEMYYNYEKGKIAAKEKFKESAKEIEEKYKEQKDEFMLLYQKELIELAISKNEWEAAIEALDDYIDEWKWDIDDMPIGKTNEFIKISQNYIDKLNRNKEKLTPDDIDNLKEVEETLRSIIGETKTTSDEDISVSSSSKGSSQDWDAVLTSYENYIDQYIKLMKKAQNGDMSAMTEYAEMMEKATDLAEKMENAGDELSATQMSKFMKLQQKLANAAMEMY